MLKTVNSKNELQNLVGGPYPTVVAFPCANQEKEFKAKMSSMAEEGMVSGKLVYALSSYLPGEAACGSILFYHTRVSAEDGYLAGDNTASVRRADMKVPKPVVLLSGTVKSKLKELTGRVVGEFYPLVVDFTTRSSTLQGSPQALRLFLFVDSEHASTAMAKAVLAQSVAAAKGVARKYVGRLQLNLVNATSLKAANRRSPLSYFKVKESEITGGNVAFVLEDGRADGEPEKSSFKHAEGAVTEDALMKFVTPIVLGTVAADAEGGDDDDAEMHSKEESSDYNGVMQDRKRRSSSRNDPRAKLHEIRKPEAEDKSVKAGNFKLRGRNTKSEM
jgi:hypothetical protein